MSRPQFSSAQQVAEYAKVEERQQQYQQQKDNALFQTANATLEQNQLLNQQLATLDNNYKLLYQAYELQLKSYEEAQKSLKRSKRFNRWTLAIAVASMLITMSGIILSILGVY